MRWLSWALVALLALTLLPAVAAADPPVALDFDSDRRNDWIDAGGQPDDAPNEVGRDAGARPSIAFAAPLAGPSVRAAEPCPLSFYPADPADASFFIGVTPYQDIAPRLCAANTSERISVEVGGTTVEGREIPVVHLTAPWTAEEAAANEALEDLLTDDPLAAESLMAEGGYDTYRPHVTVNGNIHGNEYEGLDASLDFIEYVATADGTAPIVENVENLTPEQVEALPTVDEVLQDFIITFIPSANPDGRVNGVRQNANGFDLNRDHITGSQPETAVMRETITGTLPLLFIDIHGYVGPSGLIEPCTPPHNFSYEYDLYLPHAVDNALQMEAEAFRRDTVTAGTGQSEAYIPYRDDDQGWDDWPPIFTAMYAIFHGGSGHTVEVPMNPRSGALSPEQRAARVAVNTEFARAAIDGTLLTGMADRDDLLADQLEWHVRGVEAAEQTNESLLDDGFPDFDALDLWETTYPDAYVIPMGAGQESEPAAVQLVQALLDQDVDVNQLPTATPIGGVTHPAGSWVVPMAQAKRAIAQTMLDRGQDITPRGINQMYDISGWSHTDLWGATVLPVPDTGGAALGQQVSSVALDGSLAPGSAVAYGFRITAEHEIRALRALLEADVPVQRTADGMLLVAPSARTMLGELAATEGVDFAAVTTLPEERYALDSLVVGTDASSQDRWIMDAMGLEVVPLGGGDINDGSVLQDVDVIFADGGINGIDSAGQANLAAFLDDGGGLVGYGSATSVVASAGITPPTRTGASGATNGTVNVTIPTDSEVMPGRPADDVTFVYGPSVYDTPEGWSPVAVIEAGSAGGVLEAGHWAGSTSQEDFIGEAIVVAGEFEDGERVVLTGADTLFRDHPKGLYKDLVDWMLWTISREATTEGLGAPYVAPSSGGGSGQPTDPTDPGEPGEPTDPPVDPGEDEGVERIAGADRVATALAISADTFPDGADTVVVATAADFPDALTAGPLAGLAEGPVLLVGEGAVDPAVLAEIERLAPEEIIVVGGTAAVAAEVEAELAGLAPVLRLAGSTRYGTAVAVSGHFAEPGGTVVIATGEDFADALSGGVLAGRRAAAVLLVQPGAVPAETAAELERLAPDDLVVMGGPAAVSDAVVAELDDLVAATPRRVAGATRFETAAAAAAEIGSATVAYVATGGAFADALAAVPAAVVKEGVLLLTDPAAVPQVVLDVLAELAPTAIRVLGGTSAVSEAVVAQLTG